MYVYTISLDLQIDIPIMRNLIALNVQCEIKNSITINFIQPRLAWRVLSKKNMFKSEHELYIFKLKCQYMRYMCTYRDFRFRYR